MLNPVAPRLTPKTTNFTSNINKISAQSTDVILESLNKISKLLKEGKYDIATDAAGLLKAGKIREAIDLISKNTPPLGSIRRIPEGVEVMTFDWENKPAKHLFENVKGFCDLGTVEDITPGLSSDLFQKAFDHDPKVKLGAVGWSNVKPENVQGGTSLSKSALAQMYEDAVKQFIDPVITYLKKGLGVQDRDISLVSSASYSGVDKALMDLGQQNDIQTLTITPYAYSIYAKSQHPFATVFTPEIRHYAEGYAQLAKTIALTGGRDHSFKYDAAQKWIEQKGTAIPVDVLKDFKNIIIPSKVNGKIENAAALAQETFEVPYPKDLLKEFSDLPFDRTKGDLQHPAQKALAAAIARNLK